MKILRAIPLVTLLATWVSADIFTAMADMEKLLDMEKDVVGVIDEYIRKENERLQHLRSVAKSYQEKNKNALKDGSKFLANPVNAFRVVKRLTTNWEDVESLMRNNNAEEILNNITSTRSQGKIPFPTKEDRDGAAVALLRLQDVYKLSPHEIANGVIEGVNKAEPLTAGDCYELGRVAYNKQDYYHTLMWMQEALDRLEREKRDAKDKEDITADEASVLEHLSFAMFQQGNIKHALKVTRRLVRLAPDHPRAAGNEKYYEDKLKEDGLKADGELPPIVNFRQPGYSELERKEYEALCRGEEFKTFAEQAKLYCYYKRDKPFLQLAGLKAEIVHLRPRIIIFRKVLTHPETEKIQEISTPKLKRATVHNKDTGALEHATYRISKSVEPEPEPIGVNVAVLLRCALPLQ